MKLIPRSIWRENQDMNDSPLTEADSTPPFWQRNFMSRALPQCQPMQERDDSFLEKRKDKTVTITAKDTVFITSTFFLNTTITIQTTIISTVTSTQNQTITQQIISMIPTSVIRSVTATNDVTKSVPLSISATAKASLPLKAAGTSSPSASATAKPVVAVSQHQKALSPGAIAGIVLGVLGFLALLVGILFLVRRFYRMYRKERVMRKQLQTEGNEMPAMQTGDGSHRKSEVGEMGQRF